MPQTQNALITLLNVVGKKYNFFTTREILNISVESYNLITHELCEKKLVRFTCENSLELLPNGEKCFTSNYWEDLTKNAQYAYLGHLLLPSEDTTFNESVREGIHTIQELLKKGKSYASATLMEFIIYSLKNRKIKTKNILIAKLYIENFISLYIFSISLRIHISSIKSIAPYVIEICHKIQDKRSIILLEALLATGEFYQSNKFHIDVEKRISKSLKMFNELNDDDLSFYVIYILIVYYYVRGNYEQITTLTRIINYKKIPEQFLLIRNLVTIIISTAASHTCNFPKAFGIIRYAQSESEIDRHTYSQYILTQQYCTLLCYAERYHEAYKESRFLSDKLFIYEQPHIYLTSKSIQAFSLYKMKKEYESFIIIDEILSHFTVESDLSLLPTNTAFFLEIMYYYSLNKSSELGTKIVISMVTKFLKSSNHYFVGLAKRILAINLMNKNKNSDIVLKKINQSIDAFESVGNIFWKSKAEIIKAEIYEITQHKHAKKLRQDAISEHSSYLKHGVVSITAEDFDAKLIEKTYTYLSELGEFENIQDANNQLACILGEILRAERVLIFEERKALDLIATYNFSTRDNDKLAVIHSAFAQHLTNKTSYFSPDDKCFIKKFAIVQENNSMTNGTPESSSVTQELAQLVWQLKNTWKSADAIPRTWFIYAEGEYALHRFASSTTLNLICKLLSTYYMAHLSCKQEKSLEPVMEPVCSNTSLTSNSVVFNDVLKQVHLVAPSTTNVLLLGETGVGKEVLARYIHSISERKGNFIAVNPASISENLFETEFYGHEKGAFTGAHSQKKGFFELAHEGTLFIDEVGDIPLAMQVKLLRVLEEKSFMRVGGIKEIHSNFRLITATNIALDAVMDAGSFRTDFFYRLSTFPIKIPPLRERIEDIELLISSIVTSLSKDARKNISTISKRELKILQQYSWMGNIRELRNVIERALIFHTQGELKLSEFIPQNKSSTQSTHTEYTKIEKHTADSQYLDEIINQDMPSMKQLQEQYFKYVLKKTDGKLLGENSVESILQMKKSTIYLKLKEYNIKKGYSTDI